MTSLSPNYLLEHIPANTINMRKFLTEMWTYPGYSRRHRPYPTDSLRICNVSAIDKIHTCGTGENENSCRE